MKNNELLQKKILFICPSFNSYEQEIIKEMKKRGADVYYIEDDFISKKHRFINKFLKKLVIRKIEQYFRSKLKEVRGVEFDFIFVIKGGEVTSNFMSDIKKQNKNAKFILYLWDSIKNNNNILNSLDIFDKVYSFDNQDCKNYNFLFRPTFFLERSADTLFYTSSDLLFIGTYHSDRYEILKKIISQLPSEIKTNIILSTGKMTYLIHRYIIKKLDASKNINFIFKKINLSEVMLLEEKTNVILDIHHYNQAGLTQRVFDCLIKEKKIITTNKYIKKYDFYNSNNIMIINRDDIKIDIDFFNIEYEKIDQKIVANYSIEAWFDKLFNISN